VTSDAVHCFRYNNGLSQSSADSEFERTVCVYYEAV